MQTEANKAIVRDLYEDINSRELDRMGRFVSSDLVEHAGLPGEESIGGGLERLKGQFEMALGAFPHLRYEIEDEISQRDKVVVRWKAHGIHRGDLIGIPPTGRRITLAGIHVMRVEGGQVVEHWDQQDSLGLMQQLGAAPVATLGSALETLRGMVGLPETQGYHPC